MNMYRLTPICHQHQKEYLKSHRVNAKEIAHLGDAVVERVVSTATLIVLTAERMTVLIRRSSVTRLRNATVM